MTNLRFIERTEYTPGPRCGRDMIPYSETKQILQTFVPDIGWVDVPVVKEGTQWDGGDTI